MKTEKTNFETGRKVIIWKWAKYYEVMPLINHYLINEFVLYGNNPCIRLNTKREVNKYINDFLNKRL